MKDKTLFQPLRWEQAHGSRHSCDDVCVPESHCIHGLCTTAFHSLSSWCLYQAPNNYVLVVLFFGNFQTVLFDTSADTETYWSLSNPESHETLYLAVFMLVAAAKWWVREKEIYSVLAEVKWSHWCNRFSTHLLANIIVCVQFMARSLDNRSHTL